MNYEFSFTVIYVAIYVFIALYCLTLYIRFSRNIGRDLEVYYFKLLLVTLSVFCILDSVWALGNYGHIAAINLFNLPLSVACTILASLLCYFWFCYVESSLKSPFTDKLSWQIVAFMPMGISIFLTLSTLFTGQVFRLSPEGTMAHGPLYILLLSLAFFYLLFATIHVLIEAAHCTDRMRRRGLLGMSFFIVPPTLMGLVDYAIPGMPILAPAFFFALFFVFILLQESQISNDALTGLNNRRRAEVYLDDAITQASRDNPICFFIIDGDLFKNVNDVYGHLEGDHALTTIASALKDAVRNTGAFIARWGGDEFIAVAFEKDIESAPALAEKIQDCLLYERLGQHISYPLSISIGYSVCTNPSETRRTLIQEADRMLFEQKTKSRNAMPGRMRA